MARFRAGLRSQLTLWSCLPIPLEGSLSRDVRCATYLRPPFCDDDGIASTRRCRPGGDALRGCLSCLGSLGSAHEEDAEGNRQAMQGNCGSSRKETGGRRAARGGWARSRGLRRRRVRDNAPYPARGTQESLVPRCLASLALWAACGWLPPLRSGSSLGWIPEALQASRMAAPWRMRSSTVAS